MRTKLFKPCFAAIAIALLAMFTFSSVLAETSDEVKRKIDIRIGKGKFPVDRSLTDYVDAFYSTSGTVEVFCTDIEETAFYVVDGNGRVVDSVIADTAEYPYVVLDVPQTEGIYYLVIDSPEFYGEGTIEVER